MALLFSDTNRGGLIGPVIDTNPLGNWGMFEYYGWAVLLSSTDDERSHGVGDVAEELRRHVQDLGFGAGVSDLRAVNGRYQLCLAGATNHSRPGQDVLLDLFRTLANRLPGSYGLLYTRDDEDLAGMENQFRVWRLARGELQERQDVLLSPCAPEIEDA